MEVLRMCIACRQSKDKRSLVRIVKDKEGNISIDLTGKKNGRGAYVCKEKSCFDKMKKQKGLNKAFSCNVPTEVYESLGEEIFGQD